jgi:hypothetical protein
MKNPFVYGEAVTGEYFCDRYDELKKLKLDIESCQKIFFIASRKIGKTSLIKTVLSELQKDGVLTLYIDIEGFSSYKEFLDTYLLNLLKQYSPIEKVLFYLKEILPGIKVEFSIDETNKPTLSLGYSPTDPQIYKIAQKIYNLPEVIYEKRKKKIVIVFDEFQEILKLNGSTIEAALRSSIQHQRNVAYIFAGSKNSLLSDMVTSPSRPFYKIGPIMQLKKIPEPIFIDFIRNKFHKTGISVNDDILKKILLITENNPYYVQMLCHELWDYWIIQKKISINDIPLVLEQLIENHSQDFHLMWSRLILTKKQLLKALSVSGGKNVLSKEFMHKHHLGLPASTRQTLLSLMDEGYLDKETNEYYFTDLLFREWIKNHLPE